MDITLESFLSFIIISNKSSNESSPEILSKNSSYCSLEEIFNQFFQSALGISE